MMYPVTIPPLSSTKSLDLLHLDDGKIQQPLNVGSMGGMEGSKPAGAHEKEVGGVGMGLETRYASGGIMSTLPNVSLSAFSSIAVASMSTAASQPLSSPIAGVSNGGHSGGDTTILRISAGGITEAGSDDSHGNSVSAQSGAQPRGMAGSVVNLSSSIAKGEGGSSSSLNLPNQVHPAEVVHLVAIARCTEPIDVVEDVLDSLAQHSNRGQYIICLCLESRDPHATRFGEELTVRYGLTFKRVLFYIHPSGIEKEVPGKSSNINFGVRGAHATLEKERGGGSLVPGNTSASALACALDNVVVTVADCDAKISEHYFNELSVRYAASVRERREVFFAPPSLFDVESAEAAAAAAASLNSSVPHGAPDSSFSSSSPVIPKFLYSIFGHHGAAVLSALVGSVIPSPVKIADQMWSILVLQNLSSSNWCRLPCSTYSVGLKLIASVNYWDTGVESVPEDYHTALKIYWGTCGRARCEPIFHPVIYQHIDGGGWFSTVHQRFQQVGDRARGIQQLPVREIWFA